MRIISGRCRGSVLNTLDGSNTRPTADRVKEALFNILGNVFFDKYILDLFAGSGALGLEALSRGAKYCDFVDSSKEAIKIIRGNVEKCGMKQSSNILQDDYKSAVKKLKNRYDFVFLDPPYGKDMGIDAIKLIGDLVYEGGIVALETDEADNVPEEIEEFKKYDDRKYGRTVISFFRKEGFVDGGS